MTRAPNSDSANSADPSADPLSTTMVSNSTPVCRASDSRQARKKSFRFQFTTTTVINRLCYPKQEHAAFFVRYLWDLARTLISRLAPLSPPNRRLVLRPRDSVLWRHPSLPLNAAPRAAAVKERFHVEEQNLPVTCDIEVEHGLLRRRDRK